MPGLLPQYHARPHWRAARWSRERRRNRPACAPATPSQSVDGHPFHTVHAAGLHAGRAGQADDAYRGAQWRHAARWWLIPPSSMHRLEAGLCRRARSRSRQSAAPRARRSTSPSAFCADNSFLIVEVLQRLFTHKVSVSQLSGPVGIARMAGDAAEMKGWLPEVRAGRRDQP